MTSSSAIPLSAITYVLPIKRPTRGLEADLIQYLAELSSLVPIVVADGSPPEVFALHAQAFDPRIRHLPVSSSSLNGKVAGVCDGIGAARTTHVIIADDDVRYDELALQDVAERLAASDVVVPQNVFSPLPWHARLDTGRMLLNRAFGVEYSGTVALKREAFLATRGYCGAVLFENLELLRTLEAHGWAPQYALDVFVERRPPTVVHFLRQRVRQAYDSRAQPMRLALELCLLPLVVFAPNRLAKVAAIASAALLLGEIGRRRAHGVEAFAPSGPLWSPLWLLERSVCSWLAMASLARGGAWYSGRRIMRAAHPTARLASGSCPEPICTCKLILRRVGA